MMLSVGDRFPSFDMVGVVHEKLSDDPFIRINENSYPDLWKIYFFWPKDFTFVCPTEIAEFGRLYSEFKERNTQLLGGSTDSEFVHLAWKQHEPALRELPFPMLADIKRELTAGLGILDTKEGVAKRATFIVDPEQIIRFVMVTDLKVGRNPHEVIRVLDALQTDALCPCNWKRGEDTLTLPK